MPGDKREFRVPTLHVGDGLVVDFGQEEGQLMTMVAVDILGSDWPALPPFLQRFTNAIEGCDRTARRGKLAKTFRDPEQIDILKRDFHRVGPRLVCPSSEMFLQSACLTIQA